MLPCLEQWSNQVPANMLFELVGSNFPVILALAPLIALVYLKWKRPSRLPLPPGPKRLPIVGNMFQMPLVKPWETYMEWSRKYGAPLLTLLFWFALLMLHGTGDIIFLQLPFQPTLVIGTAKAAFDLLEKRSHIYSDRPPYRMDEL